MRNLPAFARSPRGARRQQEELAPRVETRDRFGAVSTVAGADIALDAARGTGHAGVIVFSYPGLEELDRVCVRGRLAFPYVPGLLTFREGPLLLRAFARLRRRPDLLLFDGQGLAHPRRIGIASHLGLLLDRPSIGVAKSRLCGEHDEPGPRRGDFAPLRDPATGDVIGAALRTRANVRPIFVSSGHRVSLPSAIRFALACGDGFREPRPTRLADHYVAEQKLCFAITGRRGGGSGSAPSSRPRPRRRRGA